MHTQRQAGFAVGGNVDGNVVVWPTRYSNAKLAMASRLVFLSVGLALRELAHLRKLKPSDGRLGFVEHMFSAPRGLPTLRS